MTMSTSLNLSVHTSNIEKLSKELEYLNNNLLAINKIKDDLIDAIESEKHEFQLKINADKGISVTMCSQILSLMDRDISLAQSQHDSMKNDLKQLQRNLENRLEMIKRNELAINLLDHKMFEIRYEFLVRMHRLNSLKQSLVSSRHVERSESKTAFQLVEIDKNIAECEEFHELQQISVLEQVVEAKDEYKRTINFEDDILEVLKGNIKNLLSSMEVQKKQLGQVGIANNAGLEELEKAVRNFNKMKNVSDINISGQLVTYFKSFADTIMKKCHCYFL